VGANFGGAPLRILMDQHTWQNVYIFLGLCGFLVAALLWTIKQPNLSTAIHNDDFSIKNGTKLAFSKKEFWLSALYGFFMFSPLSVFADLWGVSFLESYYQIPPAQAAFYANFIYLGLGLGGFVYLWLISKVLKGVKNLVVSSFNVAILISAILLIQDLSLTSMAILLFLLGIMMAGRIPAYGFICGHMPMEMAGFTIGLINTFVMLSGLILQPLVGVVLEHIATPENVDGILFFCPQDYKAVLLIIPLGVWIAFGASLFLRDPVKK
jgi:fucose permease